jgi:hypothetical protein
LWYYKEQIRIRFLTENEFCPLIYGTWLLIWYPQTFLKAISECWMTIFNETAVTSWLPGENDRLVGVSLSMRYNVAKIKPCTFLVLKKKGRKQNLSNKKLPLYWKLRHYTVYSFSHKYNNEFHLLTMINANCSLQFKKSVASSK